MTFGATPRSPARVTVVFTLVAIAALVSPGLLAVAQESAETPPAEFSLTFDSTVPGTPTEATLHILYRDPEDPDDPDGTSPALTEVVIAAPDGAVIDGTAVPACEASNLELQVQGPAACPPSSNVGTGFGSVVAEVGPPIPLTADVNLFNYGEGVIELFTVPDTGVTAVVDRAEFEGTNKMVLHPAVVPGITEREFSWTYLGRRGTADRTFITTPPTCPESGQWTSTLTYAVTTGDTYSVNSTTPCTVPGSEDGADQSAVSAHQPSGAGVVPGNAGEVSDPTLPLTGQDRDHASEILAVVLVVAALIARTVGRRWRAFHVTGWLPLQK